MSFYQTNFSTDEKQQTERKQLQSFIDRFGAKATKAKQAKDRRKKIDKMEVLERPEHLQVAPKLSILSGSPSSFVAPSARLFPARR